MRIPGNLWKISEKFPGRSCRLTPCAIQETTSKAGKGGGAPRHPKNREPRPGLNFGEVTRVEAQQTPRVGDRCFFSVILYAGSVKEYAIPCGAEVPSGRAGSGDGGRGCGPSGPGPAYHPRAGGGEPPYSSPSLFFSSRRAAEPSRKSGILIRVWAIGPV